jgi:ATPase subunit of ABC transporter with duplicated ATPase domains
MVTHDRTLLDRTADQVLLLSGAESRLFHGNYSGLMAETALAAARDDAARIKPGRGSGSAAPARGVPDKKRKAAGGRVRRRHTFDDLETLIMAKEARVREIEGDFYSEEVYTDAELYRKLEEEARELRAELEDLYREWDTWA